MDEWYRIDNTGKIFHAVSDTTNSSVFRVSDAQQLQLTDEWGEGEKALVAFGRSFG